VDIEAPTGNKKRKPEEGTSQKRMKKKKTKDFKPKSVHNLTEDDVDITMTQLSHSTEDMIDNVSTSQRESYQQMTRHFAELQQ